MAKSRKHPTPLEQMQPMLDRLTDAEIAQAFSAADYLWRFCQDRIGREDWWGPILGLHGTLAGERYRRTALAGMHPTRPRKQAAKVHTAPVPSGSALKERAMSNVEQILLDPPDWSALSNDQLTIFVESVNSLLDYGIFRPPLATELVRYRDAASVEISARIDKKLRRPRKDRDQGT